MADIYQEIWDSDENGCSVTTRNAEGEWERPDADVRLDQQVRASGRREIDLATRPLFARVNEARFLKPTYAAFIRLLDNYIVNYRRAEEESPAERAEIDAFLEAALATRPMQIALDYITSELRQPLADRDPRDLLYHLWFEPYTNHFGRESVHFASGFEHVFVGEGKYNTRYGGAEHLGEISGYHNWIKFYFDESRGRVNFLGYCYDVRGSALPSSPNVVGLAMTWNHMDLEGNALACLFKKKGGFFVGSSPECELAMGTVAFHESLLGMLAQERRRAAINGDLYDLVMYRSTLPTGARGDQIRSFFPEFVGHAPEERPRPELDRLVVEPIDERRRNDGPVAIVAALPNPRGNDPGREWVELRNTTEAAIDLDGWELRDKIGRSQRLSGTLDAGAVRRVTLADRAGAGIQLANRAGLIALYDPSSLVALVTYEDADSGRALAFPVEAPPTPQ